MAVLLVNNYLSRPEAKIRRYVEALEAISDAELQVVRFCDVGPELWAELEGQVEAVVLSGSEACLSRLGDRAFFEQEAAFVRLAEVPVLGICFGHQLIAWAFGAEVISLPKPLTEPKEVVVEVPDRIFASWRPGDKLYVAEWHQDAVEALPPGFVRLATSGFCRVEAMMHLRRPIYGVQFHPERRPGDWPGESWDGLQVLRNFLAAAGLT